MRALIFVLALSLASCGGSSSSTAPTSTIPTVNGNYSGTATFTFPELNTTMTCPASTSVMQSGSSVNIAPIILGGQCGGLSIPFGQATINATGAIQGGGSGSYNEPSCGVYNYVASGGFFGPELRISLNATSSTCWNFNFSAVLTR